MIASMTGFAREAGATAAWNWAWEFKSVNGRNLDIRVRVPPGFDAAGEEARKQVAAVVTRGAVQIGLSVQGGDGRRALPKINLDALLALVASLGKLPQGLPVAPASLDGLLQVRGVVEAEEQQDAAADAALQADLVAAAGRAARALALHRTEEGLALREVLSDQLRRMAVLVGEIEDHPARSLEAIRARLAAQVAALMASQPAALDPGRLHQEAALMATRADVREELDRLKAHVEASEALLRQGGAIGRKLDFIAQEFGREASTLCAKAAHVDLSRIGLDLRALVDQFREQSQNVE
jgi:uncharacterized protein (TIGR00255 family)